MSTELISILFFSMSVMLLLFVLWYAWRLSKQAAKLYSAEAKEHAHTQEEVEELIEKAKEILKDSIDKSKAIVLNTDSFQQQIEKEYQEATKHASHQYKALFEKQIEAFIHDSRTSFETMSKDNLHQFKSVLDEEKSSIFDYFRARIDGEINKIKKELEEYKSSERKKIDEKIALLTLKITKDVLYNSISPEDHKKLIFKALERAKSEGLFTNI